MYIILTIIVSAYCVQQIAGRSPRSQILQKSWEKKKLARCLGDQLRSRKTSTTSLNWKSLLFVGFGLLRPQQTHHLSSLVFVWRSSGEQPGFSFSHRSAGERSGPQHPALWHSDYVGTGPKPNTPPPLFPGPWECNTLLTKSHFPFLSDFHTPVTPPPPPNGWHAPWKGDWGDMPMTLSISSTFPIIPMTTSAFNPTLTQTFWHFTPNILNNATFKSTLYF